MLQSVPLPFVALASVEPRRCKVAPTRTDGLSRTSATGLDRISVNGLGRCNENEPDTNLNE